MGNVLNCQFSVWFVKISKTNQFEVTKNSKHHHFLTAHKFINLCTLHSFKLQLHGRNIVKGSGKVLWYSTGQSPNLLSNKQIHKNLRTSGHRHTQKLFLTTTVQEIKHSYLCHAHPNHKHSSVWLRTGGCHVDSSTIGSKDDDSNWTFTVFKSGLSNGVVFSNGHNPCADQEGVGGKFGQFFF